ncbi:TolC family protein [Mucilaginibacter sp.]
MNYKYLILLIGGLCTGWAAQAQQDSLTLQQCVAVALNNNLQVRQTGLETERTRINYQQAKENLLPAVNGSVDHNLNSGRSLDPTTYTYVNQKLLSANYNLQGDLTLFNGLSLLNNIKQTRLAYQAGQMDFQQAKDAVTLNVITAYLQVLNNADLVKQANAQVEVSRQTLQRTTILNKNGAVKPSDLYDIQGQLAADELAVINAQNTLEVSKLSLLQLLNIPYQKNFKIQPISTAAELANYPYNADQVYSTALNDFAQVKSATLKRESAEKGVQVAKGSLFPTLSLYSGLYSRYAYQYDFPGAQQSYGSQLKNNYSSSFGLSLQLPLFNYFRRRNTVSLSKINLLNTQYVEESTKIQLKQSIEQAYVNMTSAYSRYQVLQSQVNAFTESFRIAQIRYNAGVLTSVDFVVIKNKLDQANTSLIISKYDYAIRTKILDYYQGKL